MNLLDWQNDDHRLVVAYNDEMGLLEALPFCPGIAFWRPVCCRPRTEGGIAREGQVGCALDALWEDPFEWLDSDADPTAATPGVWAVRWRICPAREVPVWQPWVQIKPEQVAA